MTLLMRALRRLAALDRDEVLIPAYTCYSVAASVVRAGLRPRLIDIRPDTLDLDHDELARTDLKRVLAIVATSLYGLPNDLPRLSRFAREHRLFLIDDAAQAMGAIVGGRPCGTWGDAGLFSLDKGKNVSAIDGGLIVTDSDDIADALNRETSSLPFPGAAETSVNLIKTFAYFAMLRPSLYGIPTRIPQLGLGKTVFTTEFDLHRMDPRLAALAVVMIHRLKEFTDARIANASQLLSGLSGCSAVAQITSGHDCTPVYLRLPILLPNRAVKQNVIDTLVASGIGATGSYPAALADVAALRGHLANASAPFKGARSIADRIATLPTHPFVTAADIVRIIATIQKGTATACAA